MRRGGGRGRIRFGFEPIRRQRMRCLLEELDLLDRQPAFGLVRHQEDVLTAARRAPGPDEADGRTDADKAVYPAIGFLDRFDHGRCLARQIGNGRAGVLNLAFERRDEALAHTGETLDEGIGRDDDGPRNYNASIVAHPC